MKVSSETIENYQKILAQDPTSKVFAPLAEAYREMGLLDQAEKVARLGVKRHPQYVSGFVALGRILIEQTRYTEALEFLTRASALDPQNLLALHLLGTARLQLQQPKEALKAFKRVLFLNPQSQKARTAVEKLESLTADEFEDEVFEMKKLGTSAAKLQETEKDLERTLSLVDALIVRNDVEKARQFIEKSLKHHPQNKELKKRYELLNEANFEEEAEALSPDTTREKLIFDHKVAALERLLQRIRKVQEGSFPET